MEEILLNKIFFKNILMFNLLFRTKILKIFSICSYVYKMHPTPKLLPQSTPSIDLNKRKSLLPQQRFHS